MKKTLLILVPALFLISCAVPSPRVPDETSSDPSETPVVTPVASSDILEEFDSFLTTTPLPWEARAFLDDWIGEDSENTSDLLLDRYLDYLEEYKDTARSLDGEAFLQLDPFFVTGTQTIQADKITPPTLKSLLDQYLEAGYTFIRVEGSVEPLVDYSQMLGYKKLLSLEMAAYLEYKALNSESPWAYDGELAISALELSERIRLGEAFLLTYKNSAQSASVLGDQKKYLHSFLGGLDNSPLSDGEKVKDDFIDAYEHFLGENPSSPTGKVLESFYNDLKKSGFAAPYNLDEPEDVLRFQKETDARVLEILASYN